MYAQHAMKNVSQTLVTFKLRPQIEVREKEKKTSKFKSISFFLKKKKTKQVQVLLQAMFLF